MQKNNVLVMAISAILFLVMMTVGFEITKKQNATIGALEKQLEQKQVEISELNKKLAVNEDGKHRIEIEVQECIKEQNYTTYGMNKCVYASEEKWEEEIKLHLEAIKKSLPEEEFVAIAESQDKWLAYRESQIKAIKAVLSDKMGSIYSNYKSADTVGITETRAKQLGAFVQYLE